MDKIKEKFYWYRVDYLRSYDACIEEGFRTKARRQRMGKRIKAILLPEENPQSVPARTTGDVQYTPCKTLYIKMRPSAALWQLIESQFYVMDVHQRKPLSKRYVCEMIEAALPDK